MAVLLLRLAGPLQAWGAESRFDKRDTNREPTKSGVIGMIAAALGVRREESEEILSQLSNLRFAVRVDKEGSLLRDFHIAKSKKSSYVTNRYYLSDAVFLVGLESNDDELLKNIQKALHSPVYPLFLGRRSCPVTLPVEMGIEEGNLQSVLRNFPPLAVGKESGAVRFVYETSGEGRIIADSPVSFSQKYRKYGYRKCSEEIIVKREHDPMSEL